MARTLLSAPRGGTAVDSPAFAAPAGHPPRSRSTTPPLWRELLLITLFYGAYMVTRLMINPIGTTNAFAHADQILAAERPLGLDI
jgi:hypothetical protein